MLPYEDNQYPTIYDDEDYTIWIHTGGQIVNILLRERGVTLHFIYEDFRAFREAVNSQIRVSTDGKLVNVYLEEGGLTLHFTYEELEDFGDILNSLELIPKWWLYWN